MCVITKLPDLSGLAFFAGPSSDSYIVTGNKTFDHEKTLMFKYDRTQRKISSQLVCGFHDA